MQYLSWAQWSHGFRRLRYRYHAQRYAAGWQYKLVLCLIFAGITGICAQLHLPLPWTPVPITGQTFAVLLAGIVLGKWGWISQGFYAGLGFAGVPWFAKAAGGLKVLLGPTAGYIFGFIWAAWLVGRYVDRFILARKAQALIPILLLANFLLIHAPGMIWLWCWYYLSGVRSLELLDLLSKGTIPFIPGDIMKAVLAGVIGTGILPKACYDEELDRHRAREQL